MGYDRRVEKVKEDSEKGWLILLRALKREQKCRGVKHQGYLRAQQDSQYFHRVRADKEEKGPKGLLHWGKQAVRGLLATGHTAS